MPALLSGPQVLLPPRRLNGLEQSTIDPDASRSITTSQYLGSPMCLPSGTPPRRSRQVGEAIAAKIKGKTAAPFEYRDYGSLATIGRRSAVVELGRFRVVGFLGWLFWSVAHVYFLISVRNRLVVAFNWVWQYVTFQRGARLITQEARVRSS